MSRRLVSVIATFILCLGASFPALADQLTLKNGDRVSGQIIQSEKGKVTVKTQFMGTVEIAWEAIENLTSEKALYLTLKDEQTVVGVVTAVGEQYEVQTKETGKVSVAKASITAVRNEVEYNSWKTEIERLKNPGILDLWRGSLDVGLSMARGNADSNTFTLNGNAVRATSRDKLIFRGTAIRASARRRTDKELALVANAVRGSGRYNLKLSSRFNAVAQADLEFDEFQRLDLRASLGGGLGWHAIRKEKISLDIFGGPVYTKEYFSAGTPRNRSQFGAMMGEDLTYQISERTQFHQGLTVVKNTQRNNGAGYRMQFDASLVTGLNKWLSWQVAFSDRYLSDPPVLVPALKKNDTFLTAGLRISFGKEGALNPKRR